jgi:hypothetical protein
MKHSALAIASGATEDPAHLARLRPAGFPIEPDYLISTYHDLFKLYGYLRREHVTAQHRISNLAYSGSNLPTPFQHPNRQTRVSFNQIRSWEHARIDHREIVIRHTIPAKGRTWASSINRTKRAASDFLCPGSRSQA